MDWELTSHVTYQLYTNKYGTWSGYILLVLRKHGMRVGSYLFSSDVSQHMANIRYHAKKKLSWLVDNPIDAKRLKDGNFYPSKIDREHKKRRSTSHAPQHKKRFCQLEWKWHFQSFNHRYHGIPHRWINELHYPSMFAGSMLSYVVCLPYPV